MGDLKPELIIQRLRQTILNGKLGRDYTIIPRDKNKQFREKYLVDDAKIKDILKSLDVGDYICTEESINESYLGDQVHKFGKTVHLLSRYSDKFEYEQVKLYIKFTWTKSEHGNMIIISFHEWNEIS